MGPKAFTGSSIPQMSTLSLPALGLSVACALALAAADYFRKAVPSTVPETTLLFYFLAGQVPILGVMLAGSGGEHTSLPQLGAAFWLPASADLVNSPLMCSATD